MYTLLRHLSAYNLPNDTSIYISTTLFLEQQVTHMVDIVDFTGIQAFIFKVYHCQITAPAANVNN